MGKQWKNGGDEDKFLKKEIKKGKINKFTKVSFLKKTWPAMFGEFTDGVIRNHLSALKRSGGLYLDGSESEGVDSGEEVEHNLQGENQTEAEERWKEIDLALTGYNRYVNHNYPVVCEKFKDPISEYEKVLMVVLMHGGAENVKVELSDDGITVNIKYSWPKTMYDIQDLFKKQLSKNFHVYHPMVLAYKNGLENVRKKIDMAPESKLKVHLQVQTAVDSWKKWGVLRDDGTQILLAEFTGYVKDYIKKSADESVKFEK